VKAMLSDWTTYRTRFLIRAKQLDQPLTFVDCIGREHSGQTGDYLVLSSDGSTRIAPREIFEDIYVPINDPVDLRSVAAAGSRPLPSGYRATTIAAVSMGPTPQQLSETQPRTQLSQGLRAQPTTRRRMTGRLVEV
jgi:hypothetical protein